MAAERDLLTIRDLSRAEIEALFVTAARFKAGDIAPSLKGKSVAFIFEKASTRTRISFEVGVAQLGGHPVVLTPGSSQIARGEPLKDTARILSGYCDGIIMRTYGHERIAELAQWADIPVINALTDLVHPCQVLSDCFTIKERFGSLTGRKVAWIGDGNNMAHSWINAAALLDFELVLACPEGFDPDPAILQRAQNEGAKVRVVRSAAGAAEGAIAVNTDVWASMGQEEEFEARKAVFEPYQVDARLMAAAAKDAIFLHCLPAHRGEEVTEEVLEGPASLVWLQAKNRLYVQEAIMDLLISDK